MTEPSQYFKGRTVQEQMDEVIGYVDQRSTEVAAAKADDVLQPAEDAKDAAIAAQEAAEDARDTTLAALPTIQQDITDLKAEDISLDGRLDTVELKVQTAEGNIVTIQGQIVALQTADGQNVKLSGPNGIGTMAVLLTDNQDIYGNKTHHSITASVTYPVESLVRRTPQYMESGQWVCLYTWSASNVIKGISFSVYSKASGRTSHYTASGNISGGSIHLDSPQDVITNTLKLAYDSENGTIALFCSSIRMMFSIDMSGISNNENPLNITPLDNTVVSEPTVGVKYPWVVGVTP